MINGDPNDFLDTVYSGQEIFFIYRGNHYMYQGYTQQEGLLTMELIPITEDDKPVWKCTVAFDECLDVFQKAPIFDGKTFWDAEKDIEWTDE